MKKNKLPFYLIGGAILYLLSTGISYGVFSIVGNNSTISPLASEKPGQFVVDPSLPKTEVCPLNGAKYTKMEKEIWEKRRPLAVMIENHEEARPQSGLSYADIVYETVAEGGITRFMGVFYCGAAAYNVGFAPVRSARTYYIDWLSEYDALYNHVGGAGKCSDGTVDERAKALCQIEEYGIKDLDQFSIPFPTCYRNYDRLDHEVATEHTMVCYSNKLYDLAAKRGWTNVDEENVAWDENFVQWKFKEDAKTENLGTTSLISFSHWDSQEKNYGIEWKFDSVLNSYLRSNGGKPHLDLETNKQLSAKNVIIQFTKETNSVDEHAHILYGTIGNGKALVFQDGNAITATWKKAKRVSRTIFYNEKGKEIELNRGQIWIEVVAIDTKIKY